MLFLIIARTMPDPSLSGRVLIVDDEKNVRLTLTQALEDLGLTADSVADGHDALQCLATVDYDLVLLDLRMPETSGIDVLEQMHSTSINVPVIVLTAHGTMDDVVDATRLGAADVVQKPLSVGQLRALVEDVLSEESGGDGRPSGMDEWMRLARWHVDHRRWAAAQNCLAEALDRDPECLTTLVLRGLVEAELGNTEEAEAHLSRALEIDPDSDAARISLRALRGGEDPLSVEALRRETHVPTSGAPDGQGVIYEEGRSSPSATKAAPVHRGLVLFGDHIENGVEPTDRELLRLARMSASANPRSELLLVSVVEAPPQLSPSQATDAQAERIEQRQKRLADLAQDGNGGTVGTRTRVVVAHDTSDVLRNAVEQEGIQHVVLGRSPPPKNSISVPPSRLPDALPCEVTAVRPAPYPPRTDEERVAALVGRSPHAPYVARRAFEWAKGLGLATLTLINAQDRAAEVDEMRLRERGRQILSEVAGRAGLEEDTYEARVLLADSAVEALVQEVQEFDLVSVGATRNTGLAETVFGSVPGRILETTDRSIGIVRGPGTANRSLLRQLRKRLSL
jgi:DNA-binding response OmpR family regulator/nucleotide-binding universal stress UspA family protein